MKNKEKYDLAWEYLQEKNYKKGLNFFEDLVEDNYFKAIYDLAGFYYYGLYGLKKDIKKAISFYEKAFLISKDRKVLKDLIYIKVEEIGKFRTFFYLMFKKNFLSSIILSRPEEGK